MPNITLSMPEPLWTMMRQYPWVKWSEVARTAFEAKLKELDSLPREPRSWGFPVKQGRVTKKILEWVDLPAEQVVGKRVG